jgi:hypothetical protein
MVASNVYRQFNTCLTQTVPYIDFVKERFNSAIRSIKYYLGVSVTIENSLKGKILIIKEKFELTVNLIKDVHRYSGNPARADQELTTSFLHLKRSIDDLASEVKRLHPLRYYLYGLISIFCKDPALEYCKRFKKTVALANKESLFSWRVQRATLLAPAV